MLPKKSHKNCPFPTALLLFKKTPDKKASTPPKTKRMLPSQRKEASIELLAFSPLVTVSAPRAGVKKEVGFFQVLLKKISPQRRQVSLFCPFSTRTD